MRVVTFLLVLVQCLIAIFGATHASVLPSVNVNSARNLNLRGGGEDKQKPEGKGKKGGKGGKAAGQQEKAGGAEDKKKK
ncbi:hypothetical protein GUITHDRAFT_118700 [Guillardia theta CCMP2712]|uniref:Secreted protein n=1 Tax=Guillardia theta (strain CCMP2712) TaxID=905079 RepID=L1IGC7_GUITC|nr:hypothetical protein GUITHDRAFT_118700 [Guillardia theta CCMP2712]EKX35152.1 hypothetical protein GUITHDRAFT_118700 [Guillardia theta CCMP2712]|eukprot:XP_005822132.1 hypothetical protein GUITHDRAFT_118700 [Guillardia theta CCMP2712]